MKSGSPEFGSVGAKYGQKTVTLGIGEIPSHTHSGNIAVPLVNSGGAGAFTWGVFYEKNYSGGNLPHTTYATGSGGAHNNLQPTATALLVIRT